MLPTLSKTSGQTGQNILTRFLKIGPFIMTFFPSYYKKIIPFFESFRSKISEVLFFKIIHKEKVKATQLFQNSALSVKIRLQFGRLLCYLAPFELCGRAFGRLATQEKSRYKRSVGHCRYNDRSIVSWIAHPSNSHSVVTKHVIIPAFWTYGRRAPNNMSLYSPNRSAFSLPAYCD